ncbi:unnamed protein product [Discosporangium mesarthrocarpum]
MYMGSVYQYVQCTALVLSHSKQKMARVVPARSLPFRVLSKAAQTHTHLDVAKWVEEVLSAKPIVSVAGMQGSTIPRANMARHQEHWFPNSPACFMNLQIWTGSVAVCLVYFGFYGTLLKKQCHTSAHPDPDHDCVCSMHSTHTHITHTLFLTDCLLLND